MAPAAAEWGDEGERVTIQEVRNFYKKNKLEREARLFEEELARLLAPLREAPAGVLGELARQAGVSGGLRAAAPAPEVPAAMPVDTEARSEDERRQAQSLWQRVQRIAAARAVDGLQELYAKYLWDVYHNKAGGRTDDVRRQVAYIRFQLSEEVMGASLPMAREGEMPGPNVLATYTIDRVITMRRGLRSLRVFSHEFFHHGDNMVADGSPIGQNEETGPVQQRAVAMMQSAGRSAGRFAAEAPPETPAPEMSRLAAEQHAYDHMGCDVGMGGTRC